MPNMADLLPPCPQRMSNAIMDSSNSKGHYLFGESNKKGQGLPVLRTMFGTHLELQGSDL